MEQRDYGYTAISESLLNYQLTFYLFPIITIIDLDGGVGNLANVVRRELAAEQRHTSEDLFTVSSQCLLKLLSGVKVHQSKNTVRGSALQSGDSVSLHAKGLEKGVDPRHLLLAVVVHVKGRVVSCVVNLGVDCHREPVADIARSTRGILGLDGLRED